MTKRGLILAFVLHVVWFGEPQEALPEYAAPPIVPYRDADKTTFYNYFYRHPTISPYINQTMPWRNPAENYYLRTLPEIERRDRSGGLEQQRALRRRQWSDISRGSYFNNWYAGRQRFGS